MKDLFAAIAALVEKIQKELAIDDESPGELTPQEILDISLNEALAVIAALIKLLRNR